MFCSIGVYEAASNRQAGPVIADSHDLLETALAKGRRDGALTLNLARIALAGGAGAIYLLGVVGFGIEGLRQSQMLVLAYGVAAIALFLLAKRSELFARLSRFAVPVIDMPFTLVVQWINIEGFDNQEAVAMFTLSIFLFLTIVSALSMRTMQVFAAAGVATVLQSLLEWHAVGWEAGEPNINYFSAPVMLFLTAWMAADIPRRRVNLIREMAEREARRSRLARYFSPGVAEVIEARDELGEGEACEISVMFADIRGFTKMSENLDAAEVVAMLNEFHGHMVEEVFAQAGTLDKYLGDGLMAYFNAPVRQPDHAIRAVKCALEMVAVIDRWNERKQLGGDERLEVGIGIHSGSAIVGVIGAPHRREFTAIGDTVNVASRLQGLTKEFRGSILVSEPVRVLASADPTLTFVEAGEADVRGRAEKVRVFRPEAVMPDRERQ